MSASLTQLANLLESLTADEFRKAHETFHLEEERRGRAAALAFRGGDLVWFLSRAGVRVQGVVERVNLRTVAVRARDGVPWRVAPQFLQLETPAGALESEPTGA